MEKYNKEQVASYYQMMEDYDNAYILNKLRATVPSGCSVLELGFGTGQDYLQLKEDYQITASDYSEDFIEAFNRNHDDQILQVDAIQMEVTNKYDCIYSSKVLNSLVETDIIKSLTKQYDCLNDGGYIFHTLWYGDKTLDSSFIDKSFLRQVLALDYDYVEFSYYKEADYISAEFDSVIIIGRKHSGN